VSNSGIISLSFSYLKYSAFYDALYCKIRVLCTLEFNRRIGQGNAKWSLRENVSLYLQKNKFSKLANLTSNILVQPFENISNENDLVFGSVCPAFSPSQKKISETAK